MQILLLLTIVVGVKSDGAPFNECATDAQCPADATCIDTNNNSFNDRCSCNTDFFPIDTGVTVDGVPQTMCTRKYLSMHVQLSMFISYSSATILEKYILCLFFYYYKLKKNL